MLTKQSSLTENLHYNTDRRHIYITYGGKLTFRITLCKEENYLELSLNL